LHSYTPPDDDGYYTTVEHHAFTFNHRYLLLEVESLEVHRLGEDARLLLETNCVPASEMDWRSKGTAAGLTRKAAGTSFRHLRELGIIVSERDFHETKHENVANDMPESSDYVFMVNVAQICNLRCAYCYTHEGHFDFEDTKSRKMTPEIAARIARFAVRQFPRARTLCFHFYGGEPLIGFPAIRGLVEETKRNKKRNCNFEFAITTNGTLLTKEIADFMDEHGFTVFLSIDGPESVHNKFRVFPSGRGSYDLVRRNYDYLTTKRNIRLIGSSVIRSGWTLPQAEQFLTEIGVDQYKAERVRVEECNPLGLMPEEHEKYVKDLDTLFDIYVEAVRGNTKPLDYRLTAKILQIWTKTKRSHFCPAGERMFGVTADGEIYPCSLHAGRRESFLGTLEGGIDIAKMFEFRKRISADGQETCRTCWNRNLCGGGCSAMTNRFGHEECDVLKRKSEIAVAIYDEISHDDELKFLNLVSPKTYAAVGAIRLETDESEGNRTWPIR